VETQDGGLMPNRTHYLKNLVSDTRGAEIAEAAAVLPLMFMFLIGIFWFGQAFSIYGAITRAAQDGARAGSLPYCATCGGDNTLTAYAANAASAVQKDLIASRLDPSLAQYPSSHTAIPACAVGGGSKDCDPGASAKVCIQSPIQLTTAGAGATGLCGISVSLSYPYRFWLPFTSVNKQTIWITAAARSRLETR
jgi:hypothetical protein